MILEIYQMAARVRPCDNFPMVEREQKKADAESRAKSLYGRLMSLPLDPPMSNNAWTRKAGVNSSFFTNIGGVAKSASEPSIGNLRLVLEAAGTTVPEFFLDEAKGALIRAPTIQALEQALADVWDELPSGRDRQISFVASTVLRALALPQIDPATQDSAVSEEGSALAG